MRVASLLPSATEMVCGVGAQSDLVGVSHECDFPAGVADLPILTRTRTAMPKTSGEIDLTVREMLTSTLAVYEVLVETLRETKPDVIVTQDLCDVCAVSLDDVRKALRELAREDITLVNLKPTLLADVWDDVRRVADALGRSEEGERVALSLASRCTEIAHRAAEAASSETARPSVLTIEWLDPIMIGGTWMPELVDLAGGHALVTKAGEHAPTLNLEELSQLDPDFVLIKPCGFELERTVAEITLLRDRLPWKQWKAVQQGRVFAADGNAFFNRPGPRLVESLEILAACLRPEVFADFVEKHQESVFRVTADLALEPLTPIENLRLGGHW